MYAILIKAGDRRHPNPEPEGSPLYEAVPSVGWTYDSLPGEEWTGDWLYYSPSCIDLARFWWFLTRPGEEEDDVDEVIELLNRMTWIDDLVVSQEKPSAEALELQRRMHDDDVGGGYLYF